MKRVFWLFGIAVCLLPVRQGFSEMVIAQYEGLAGNVFETQNNSARFEVAGTSVDGVDAALLRHGDAIFREATDSSSFFTATGFNNDAGTLEQAIQLGEFVSFGFSVAQGFTVDLDTVALSLNTSDISGTEFYLLEESVFSESNSDPQVDGFSVDDVIGSGQTSTNFNITFTFDASQLSGVDEANFRLYFVETENTTVGIGAGPGSVGIHINGSLVAVPEPSSLSALSIVGLFCLRRRRG